ncbi:MAG: DUF2267 domain-containing protein [Pirellulaceae bacterium]|nr:DUF2267 domain-containing protein [Pirellulaceae bacterium]
MINIKIAAFESTVEKSNEWIREVMDEMQWEDPQRAYHGLRAVLHTLRDRLTVHEATDLAAQLPMLLRGMYYESWTPAKTPVRDRTKEQFLNHIDESFANDLSVDSEELTRAVFIVLGCHVTQGELDDVKAVLPAPIRELWADHSA